MAKKIYEARLPDENDGRGTYSGGYFSNEAAARFRAADGNVMGFKSPGSVCEIPVYDTYEEFLAGQRDEKRRRALAKLTAEERRVLGL